MKTSAVSPEKAFLMNTSLEITKHGVVKKWALPAQKKIVQVDITPRDHHHVQ